MSGGLRLQCRLFLFRIKYIFFEEPSSETSGINFRAVYRYDYFSVDWTIQQYCA